jgi:hypothetical protein
VPILAIIIGSCGCYVAVACSLKGRLGPYIELYVFQV